MGIRTSTSQAGLRGLRQDLFSAHDTPDPPFTIDQLTKRHWYQRDLTPGPD